MCSLQEAYNVPSFDPVGLRKKRGCSAPLRTHQQQPPPDSTDNGERAAYEHFTDGSMYTSKGATNYNIPASATNAASYTSRADDNKYYCENFNVCPPELFTNAPVAQKPKQKPRQPPQQCTPLQASPYTYPMSDETKQQFSKAMETALDDTNSQPTAPKPQPMRKADMNSVSGYYDEELEQYLQTKDFASVSTLSPVATRPQSPPAKPYDPEDSPFAITMNKLGKDSSIPDPKPLVSEVDLTPPSLKSNNKAYIFDIFLFVSAGLLIILLCDQLFRFGVALGIKETVTLLKPFMEANTLKQTQ